VSAEAVAKLREAQEALQELACEAPPPNGKTLKELVADADKLDNASLFGQIAWLKIAEAIEMLERKEAGT